MDAMLKDNVFIMVKMQEWWVPGRRSGHQCPIAGQATSLVYVRDVSFIESIPYSLGWMECGQRCAPHWNLLYHNASASVWKTQTILSTGFEANKRTMTSLRDPPISRPVGSGAHLACSSGQPKAGHSVKFIFLNGVKSLAYIGMIWIWF